MIFQSAEIDLDDPPPWSCMYIYVNGIYIYIKRVKLFYDRNDTNVPCMCITRVCSGGVNTVQHNVIRFHGFPLNSC